MEPMLERYTPGRYRDCRFCGGRGCSACDSEANKAFEKFAAENPPIEFKTDTPEGMASMKEFVAGLIGDDGAAQLETICKRVNAGQPMREETE